MPTRYEARRVLTQTVIAQELPIDTDGGQRGLSASGSFRGSLPASLAFAEAADGHPVFEKWGTLLVAIDDDGGIEWFGIVTRADLNGTRAEIEATTPRGYLQRMDYAGPDFDGVDVDPADVVRHIVGHLQGYAGGNLGIVVTGSTPVRLGTASDRVEAAATAKRKASRAAYDDLREQLRVARALLASRRANLTAVNKSVAESVRAAPDSAAKEAARKAGEPRKAAAKAPVDQQVAVVDALAKNVAAAKKTTDADEEARKIAAERARADGGSYRLQWWENIDCGREIDELASEAPFDYTERWEWDGERVVPYLDIHYPRAGRNRGATFAEGVNIIERTVLVNDGAEYANEVQGLGAGEGEEALRHIVSVPDWRMRRTRTVERRDVSKRTRLDAVVRADLRVGQIDLRIPSIVVVDHPHARLAELVIGDDVEVTVQGDTFGRTTRMCRIVGIAKRTTTVFVLTLRMTAEYTYGD